MDDLDDWKSSLEQHRRFVRQQAEEHWRSFIANQNKHVEDGFVTAVVKVLDDWKRLGMQRMATVSEIVRTDIGEQLAATLHDAIPKEENMDRNLRQALGRLQQTDGVNLETTPVSDTRAITIESDTDEGEHPVETVRSQSRGSTRRATGRKLGKRAGGSAPTTSVPRPKRTCRTSRKGDIYEPTASDSEETLNLTGVRTIQAENVRGLDFIFPYSRAGPGYFVIRCSPSTVATNEVFHFVYDPFQRDRAKSHFSRGYSKCHSRTEAGTYTPDQIIQRFGYRVVNTDGSDVDREWVEQSNIAVANERDRKKAKGKQNPSVQQQGTGTLPPARYGPARRGHPVDDSPAASASAAAAPGPARCFDASRMPMADMHGPDAPEALQEASVSDADRAQTEDEDMFQLNRFVSDILDREEHATTW